MQIKDDHIIDRIVSMSDDDHRSYHIMNPDGTARAAKGRRSLNASMEKPFHVRLQAPDRLT